MNQNSNKKDLELDLEVTTNSPETLFNFTSSKKINRNLLRCLQKLYFSFNRFKSGNFVLTFLMGHLNSFESETVMNQEKNVSTPAYRYIPQ